MITYIQANIIAEEEIEGSLQHGKKIKRERRKVEAELEENDRNYELRWEQFIKESGEAAERAERRLEVLGGAIDRHSKNNDSRRLQRSELWQKKAIASGKKLLEQAKTKEESFEEVGITGDTDTTFLDQLLEQQRTLIAFERSNRNNRNP